MKLFTRLIPPWDREYPAPSKSWDPNLGVWYAGADGNGDHRILYAIENKWYLYFVHSECVDEFRRHNQQADFSFVISTLIPALRMATDRHNYVMGYAPYFDADMVQTLSNISKETCK